MQTNSVQSFTKLHIASVGKGNICWSHHFLKSLPLCCLTPVIPFMFSNVSLLPETRFVAPQHWTSPDRPRKTKTASSLFFCQVHEKCMWRRRPVKYNFKPNNSAQKQMVMPSRKENRTFWSNLVVQNCYSNRQWQSAIGKCLSTEIQGIQHFSRPGSRHKYPCANPCSIVCCMSCRSRHFSCTDKADIERCLRSTFRVKIQITTWCLQYLVIFSRAYIK